MSMIGKSLAHYSVTAEIGKGGMGEVYQAKDTKLGRDVAIKVLPEGFARDADRVARFQREARLLASLNHPNIASIHGLEEADSIHFLVLELVQGQTLAELIKAGPVPVEKALKLALQITEALEAAHEKGVIHRDLKPTNIKVTPEGKVKVLDFGLAKAYAGDSENMNLSNSPTLSDAATQQGVILGTAAYMPPEQAKGKSVDKRADIWAFGVVVFEMLTGRQLFVGETVSETLAAVLMKDVDFGALPPNLHLKIKEMLERCLEKDPKDRYGSIGDARFEVQKALTDPRGVEVKAAGAGSGAGTRSKQTLVWASVTVILIVIAVIAVWNLRTPESRSFELEYVLPEDQVFNLVPGGYVPLAISPDGSQFVYGTTKGLYIRTVGTIEAPRHIDGSDDNSQGPFFSPDGQSIGYYSPADQMLKKIAISGGSPFPLCKIEGIFGGARWYPDRTITFSSIQSGIMTISDSGGTPEPLFKEESGVDIYPIIPQMLPDKENVLFTNLANVFGLGPREITIQSLKSGKTTPYFAGKDAMYLPTEHILYGQLGAPGGVVYVVPFDINKLEIAGNAVPLPERVNTLAVSDKGTLAYVPLPPTTSQSDSNVDTDTSQGVTLWWVDRNGQEEQIYINSSHQIYRFPQISPDGNKVALMVEESEDTNIWILDLTRENLELITQNELGDDNPIWIPPDGQQIVYSSTRNEELPQGGSIGIFRIKADGTGESEYLVSLPDQVIYPTSITKDGETLVVGLTNSGWDNFDIGMVSMDGDHSFTPLFNEDYNETQGQLSPNGRLLAYSSNKTGELEVYVCSFPDVNSNNKKVSTDGGSSPVWSRDGSELFYLKGSIIADTVMVVEVETEPEFKAGKPKVLFTGEYLGWASALGTPYDIHPDGRFLMMKGSARADTATPSPSDLRKVIVKTNWFEELNKLAPAD